VPGGGPTRKINDASRKVASEMKSYEDVKEVLQHELALNRNERFYTGMVLPALLVNGGR
jgi:hypothetical protein